MQSLLNLKSVGNNIARKTLAAEIQRRPVMVENAAQQQQHRQQQGANDKLQFTLGRSVGLLEQLTRRQQSTNKPPK